MVRPYNKLMNLAAASTDYFAAAATGANFVLTNNATPDGLGHKISFTNNTLTDLSAIDVTITGLDQDGKPLTETFPLPKAGQTETSTYFFSYLASAVPSATIGADTVVITYTDAVAGVTLPLNWRGGLPIISVIVTGTINYTVQFTDDLINQGAKPPYNWLSNAGSPLTNATNSESDTFDAVPLAVRLLINSYDGATALFQVSQKDI